MGLFQKCCNNCGHPNCVGTFDLPVGSKSFTFETESGHPISKSGLATFARTSDSPCCVASTLNIDELWDSGFVTGQIAVEDSWRDLQRICCFGVSSTLCIQGEYDYIYHGGVSLKTRSKIRFCSVAITICAAKLYVYGVLTCGIWISATLSLKHTGNDANSMIHQLKQTGTQYLPFGGFPCASGSCIGTTTLAINTVKDCLTNFTIPSLSDVPPALPADFSVPDAECSGTLCSITRQIFIPSVTVIPSLITFTPSMETSRLHCDPVQIFDPCDPIGAVVLGTLGTDTCGRVDTMHNIGEFCGGVYPCQTGPFIFEGTSSHINKTISARTRTVSKTQSHPDGTVLFNPFADDWRLSIA